MLIQLPRAFCAEITLPTSKSISARALIIRALCDMPCPLTALSDSDDTRAMETALGKVASNSQSEEPLLLDIGAAGTAMRFLTAFLATRVGKTFLLTGSQRMKQRPIAPLVEALRTLGAEIDYAAEEGFPPLRISGKKLRGGTVELPAQISSQYVSALLMIAPTLEQGLHLHLRGEIASAPYISMTLALMKTFGVEAKWEGNQLYVPSASYHAPASFTVEPDWSAASYWYELVALSPDPETRGLLRGLHAESVQGDAACVDLFAPLGVKTEFTREGACLTKQNAPVSALYQRDFSATPDLAQTLVVTCALLRRAFRFTGLASLHIKETDRIAALTQELQQFGVQLTSSALGTLQYVPDTPSQPLLDGGGVPQIHTYDDHRMALAFAPAALVTGAVEIHHPEVISKSYPHYWDDLRRLG